MFSWQDFIRKESTGSLSYQDATQAYAAIDEALARSLAAVQSHKATTPPAQEIPPHRMEQATLMPRPQTWRGIEASLPTGDR